MSERWRRTTVSLIGHVGSSWFVPVDGDKPAVVREWAGGLVVGNDVIMEVEVCLKIPDSS